MKETDLAALVVGWLQSEGWDVYQEVSHRGMRADIYAVRDGVTQVIESKTTFGLKVIEQAYEWRFHAHYVSIAVPKCSSQFGQWVCRDYGIGILTVHDYSGWRGDIRVEYLVEPRLIRTPNRLKQMPLLHEEQKTYAAAGNNEGRYFTPFKATCQQLMWHVKDNPGCSMKDAVDAIRHHYASNQSARQHLAHWIERDKVEGVRLERDGRLLRLYPSHT